MAGRSIGRTASTVGMMEGAFFVSRTELLAWVNGLLQVSLTKVEQCASGAVYCQVIDACHPGTVAMRRVNWMAQSDHEFIPNYKLLQAAFDKNHIEKHIDVDKLIRAKYQDNLEFLQWMKCYWEREGAGREDYDPVAARESKPLPPWAKSAGGGLAPCTGGTQERGQDKAGARPKAAAAGSSPPPPPPPPHQKVAAPSRQPVAAVPRPATAGGRSPRCTPPRLQAASAPAEEGAPQGGQKKVVEELKARVASQQGEMDDLNATLHGLERERDYYFRKLREVEILCTTLQSQMKCEQAQVDPALTAERLVKDIQLILYAENDEASPVSAGVDHVIAADEC